MRGLLRLLSSVVVGFLAAFVVLVLLSVAIGWRPYTVLTGSMRPGIDPGDVVVNKPINPVDARVGDVVTFPDPTRGGDQVTHRVRRITVGDGKAGFVTKGDANDAPERWEMPVDQTIGRVVYRIPVVGHVSTRIAKPLGRYAVTIPAVLLGLWLLVIAVRPARPAAEEPSPS